MKQMEKCVLILPNIRSSHNVGAMFRTADACGFGLVYLVGYTPVPPRPDIHKVALGAEEFVSSKHRKSVLQVISYLRGKGYRIIALEKTAESVSLDTVTEVSCGARVALIVGNEVDGVDNSVLNMCDSVVHIPMRGKKESLNVSVAAGIAMHHIGIVMYGNTRV